MARLYAAARLHVNFFFQPSFKLVALVIDYYRVRNLSRLLTISDTAEIL
jgi:hypothetical protein